MVEPSPYLGEMLNGHGVQVSAFHCGRCDSDFTVCPPPESRGDYAAGCLADDCDSYDPRRDCDVLFMSAAEIVREKPAEHLLALLLRAGTETERQP